MSEDVSHLTGENDSKRPPKNLILNEVRFNGKKGKFTYVNLIDRKDGEKAVEIDLGESVNVIVLKIRRRISGFNKPLDTFYTSTEHNAKDDVVYLFGAKEKGISGELSDKYRAQGIKMQSQRVLYAFLLRENMERELVRLVVKGSTMNWKRDGKSEDHMDFFDYTQREKAKDDHIYMSVTTVYSGEETGPLGEYYTMYFKVGPRVPKDKLDIVTAKIKELHALAVEQDSYYRETATQPEPDANLPTIEYPEEDINPEDIPF